MIYLRPDLQQYFPGSETEVFDRVLTLEGENFRSMPGRRTLRFCLAGHGYFVKIHLGVGWREILKNLFQFRLPVLGAENEMKAIRRLEELGVSTMTIAGFGKSGRHPARRRSFLITDELKNTLSLEDYCRDWTTEPPPRRLKQQIIKKVAEIAGALHDHGVNHRDFYICHFLLDLQSVQPSLLPGELVLYLIDLHRVQLRRKTPVRWLLKDLAGLYFSCMDNGLTRRDRLRFMRLYRGLELRRFLIKEERFWTAVEKKALRLYQKPLKSGNSGN